MKTDDDDFLLQSIASVLPQSSSSRREHTGLGSPPKKVRAVTGDTARASTGPKRNLRAVVTKHTQTCLCVRDVTATSTQASSSESTCDYVAMSSSAALFNAALQSSSLVESAQTSEKVRDASSLRQQVSNEGSDTLSDDNYSRFGDEEETVDTKVPEDVVEEFQAEQLLIDCSVLLDTAHHGTAKPATRTSASRIAMPTWGTNLRNGSNTMPRNESSGAAALAAFASLKTVSSASALPDGDAASPKNASEKSLPLATRRSASANATFKTRLTPARSSRDAEKQTVVHASKMNKKSVNDSVNSRAAAHVASQRRIKPTVPPKPGVSTTNTSTTLAAPNANKLKSSRPAQPRVSISERNDSMNGIKSSSRDLEAVAHSGVPSSDFPLTTSAVTASRSVRVPPFNYRNPQEVTAAQRCDGNLLNVEKSAEVDNSSTCDLHDELKKKPNVKQMLVTTV
ncbi:unnamed protein product [Toxocara canis]|nr:unnamed protein product [Toxocara canis]